MTGRLADRHQVEQAYEAVRSELGPITIVVTSAGIEAISSSSAQSGAPRMAHYAASKGGVIGLTKALARELARNGITANTIPPTIVDTPMARQGADEGNVPPLEKIASAVPLGRAGTPEDIAGMCAYLCSEDGSYFTGQVLGVNGGMYM